MDLIFPWVITDNDSGQSITGFDNDSLREDNPKHLHSRILPVKGAIAPGKKS